MKRITKLILLISILITPSLRGQNVANISSLATENGKTFIKVNEVPFPVIGAQIRIDFLMNCDGKTIQECKPFFEKAKELGVNCVQIPVSWKLIEPAQDNFSWSVLDQVLAYVNEYDLKMELLWFSTNMCGESFSNYIPDYILNDNNLSDIKLIRKDGIAYPPYWSYYGYQYNLILNDSRLLARETNAVSALMEHIRVWDTNNGSKHPVISVQVHNEPDIFARWRCDQLEIRYSNNNLVSKTDAWNMTLDALNTVGKAFKNSNYRVVTRTNLVTSAGLNSFSEISTTAGPTAVYNLEGIDIVSTDPYVTSIDIIKSSTLAFLTLPNHYPLIAENKGCYENGASLLLTAISLGSGYNFYDLATSKHVIDNTTEPDAIDHGVYTWDLQEKSHTPKVKAMTKGLVKAFPDVATTSKEDFVAFNIQNDNPQVNHSQTINSSKIKLSFSTTAGASGFSITKDNYVLIYCTEAAQIELSNADFSNAVTGSFNSSGIFETDNTLTLTNSCILNAEGNILYKITYANSSPLTSTAEHNIGTMPVADVIDYLIIDFENETTTWELIDHLHTDEGFQTNTAYSRDLYFDNPDLSGLNNTSKCAQFSGYNSDNEWWYGLDIVLKNAVSLPAGNKYVHALMKSNITNVDMNKACIPINSSWSELGTTWVGIDSEWQDYVFPINDNSTATSLKEMRFMLNHKTAGQITYLDQITISNSPAPRTIPDISTEQLTIDSPLSVSVGGNVCWHGNSAVSERGICWSTSPNPTINDNKIACGSGVGEFNAIISLGTLGSKYYFRSYAVNSVGIGYGNQQSVTTPKEFVILDFENKQETDAIIEQLHLDWQTNTAYSRNLEANNLEKAGTNITAKCAEFSGYNSGDEWWYGLDIVLNESQLVSSGMYLHVMMKTNNTAVDTNRGLKLLDSSLDENNIILESWHSISDSWADYVYEIPVGVTEFKEMRFMFNHKAAGQITYLDQIRLNNDPNPMPPTAEVLTWIGNTTAWDNPANWKTENEQPGFIPSSITHVTIPENTSIYPVLTDNAYCNTITFQPGTEIGNQHLLTVTQNEGATVEFNLNAANTRWNMLSLPVAGLVDDFTFRKNAGDVDKPYSWLLKFVPEKTEGNNTEANWLYHKRGEPLAIGEGFAVSIGVFDEDGKLDVATSDETVTLTGNLHSDAKFEGKEELIFGKDSEKWFALVGNPFMTSIDFKKLYENNSGLIKNYYLVWTLTGNQEGFTGYLGTGETFGIIADEITGDENSHCIAPLQAFFVEQKDNATGGTLRFDLADEGGNIQSITATGRGTLRAFTSTDYGKLDIIAENGTVPVKTFIADKEGMEPARKLMNGCEDIPDIYTLSPEDNTTAFGAQVINSNNVTVPIGIATERAGSMKLTFSGMSSYVNTDIKLYDTVKGEMTSLTGDSFECEFDYTPPTMTVKDENDKEIEVVVADESRFYLVFSPTEMNSINNFTNNNLSVYAKNNIIHAGSTATDLIREITIYNIQGRMIHTTNNLNTPVYRVNVPENKDVYIVRVVTENGVKNVKVISK